MKKILLTLTLATASLFTFAQSASFGVKGGVSFAKLNLSSSSANISANTGSVTTFSAGLFADFKFGNLSLQPAALYAGKGGNIDAGTGDEATINLYYLQVPVNLVYRVPAAIGNVYFGAGPYAAFGLSGKVKGTSDGNSVSQDVTFGDGDEDFKSTEFGLNGIAGVELKNGFLLGVNYDLGLSNITNSDSSDGALKNRVFGISVGFKF